MDIVALLVALAALIAAGVALLLLRQVGDVTERVSGGLTPSRDEARLRDLARRVVALEGTVGHGGSDAGSGPLDDVDAGRAITRIGLVRFDAFEDAGGAQSFAVALLDAAGDGIVLTSLHARPGTRVYIKAIRGGEADAPLGEEEQRALAEAQRSRRTR